MFNPHTTFEVCIHTCNEDMKGKVKCKNSRFEPPFGGFGGNAHRVHLWLDGKRIVDFLLVIFELFSLALTAIKRNLSKSAFSEGWVI